ncbi:AhpC/TSA family protein [Flavobacteriaceae bacterium F08102]|nr:AhpC/TSA family protein [Flavobacteriaceae bacterium F08102]
MNKQKLHVFLTISMVIILAVTSCKKEPSFEGYTINGTVKGLDEATIRLVENNFADRRAKRKVIDSTQMVSGVFNFKGSIEHPDQVMILIGDTYHSGFFLENSPITLAFDIAEADRGNYLKAKVTGSLMQQRFDEQMAKIDSILNQEKFQPLVDLRAEMEKVITSKDEEKIEAYKLKAAQFSALQIERTKERKNYAINYVKEHPNSPVAPWVLGFQFSEGRMSKEEMKEVYPLFKGEATHTAMFKFYEKTYNDLFKNLGVGSIAPDFSLTDVNGTEQKLSEVKAKYKLVDFWASWCVPCRASFPHLKELYATYHDDGFEVVGIGTADEEQKWRNAIEEDELPWMHLYDQSENHQWGVVAAKYGVPFLPTTFLMDENEKIILRNPSKEELDAKLKELFGY